MVSDAVEAAPGHAEDDVVAVHGVELAGPGLGLERGGGEVSAAVSQVLGPPAYGHVALRPGLDDPVQLLAVVPPHEGDGARVVPT